MGNQHVDGECHRQELDDGDEQPDAVASAHQSAGDDEQQDGRDRLAEVPLNTPPDIGDPSRSRKSRTSLRQTSSETAEIAARNA